jgi:hypothetical protein
VPGKFTGGTLPDIAVADVLDKKIHLLKNQSTTGNLAFTLARSFTVDGDPYGIAAADFDQNGTLDLVVADKGTNQVNVVLLSADGTQASNVAYPTAAAPYWVTAADFNGDGKPDLATAGGANVSVLLNQGAGQFGAKLDLSVGGDNRHLLAADLNQDQKIDLVVPGYSTASIHVLLGNGDGTFSSGHAISLVAACNPDWVAAGDFNADGALDLAAIQNATNTVSFLPGVGDGFFGSKVDYPTGNRPNSVAVGDFNEDTILDLVTCNGVGDSITIFLGQGVCN